MFIPQLCRDSARRHGKQRIHGKILQLFSCSPAHALNVIDKLLLEIKCVIFVGNIAPINLGVNGMIGLGVLAAHLNMKSVRGMNQAIPAGLYMVFELSANGIVVLTPYLAQF